MHKECKFIKDDGEPCQTPVMEGSEYCFFHDPSKVVERLEAASRGGKSRVKVLDQSDIKIKSLTGVVRLLEQTVNQVLRDRTDRCEDIQLHRAFEQCPGKGDGAGDIGKETGHY